MVHAESSRERTRLRLAYFVSHPIQYQAPLLRRIAQEPGIDLTVFFASDFSIRGYQDRGFGVEVKWDVPLLEGYKYEFLPRLADSSSPGPIKPLNLGFFRRLRSFDVLWAHGYSSLNFLHAAISAKALGIPVLTRSDSWLGDRVRSSWKLALKQAYFEVIRQLLDGVLVGGTLNREYWQHHLGKDFPTFLMPYAVDNEYFQRRSQEAAPQRESLRKELGLDPSRPVILYASKLQRRKHCDHLIQAYRQLSPGEGREPDPYLLIIGDGEQRQELESMAGETGFQSIRFLGFRNQAELPRFFDLADVFVLPARHEPWGLIVNEVMNAARPVIVSSDVGCHPDLIQNGKEGFVFPTGDVDALASSLKAVFATPETSRQMGKAALERIRQWGFEEDIVALRQALSSVTGRSVA